VLDAGALLIDDDMPKVLNADALLPDDDNNDARWHGTVMAPFCLFFCFSKRTSETCGNYARLRFRCNSRCATVRVHLQFERNGRHARTTHVSDVL
jgi:hypothetical protein